MAFLGLVGAGRLGSTGALEPPSLSWEADTGCGRMVSLTCVPFPQTFVSLSSAVVYGNSTVSSASPS